MDWNTSPFNMTTLRNHLTDSHQYERNKLINLTLDVVMQPYIQAPLDV